MKSQTNRVGRGFRRERHSLLKAAMAGVALIGFGGGWATLASAHSPVEDSDEVVPATTVTAEATRMATAVLPTSTPLPTSSASPTVGAAPPQPTNPAVTRSPKRSRGS